MVILLLLGLYGKYYYGEGDSRSIAKDTIEMFIQKAKERKGFFIGRYEQGEENQIKKNLTPIVNITRDKSKEQAEMLYKGNQYVVSELISSYAWDTALNFICQTSKEGYLLSTTADNKYGNNGTGKLEKTGRYKLDKYSNIYDIIGNATEWTT